MSAEQEKVTTPPQYYDVSKPPIMPNSVSISSSSMGIMLTFLFIPPENNKSVFVLGRFVVPPKVADALADGLKRESEKAKKIDESVTEVRSSTST